MIPLNINTIKNEMFQNIKVELLKNFTVCVCVCVCVCVMKDIFVEDIKIPQNKGSRSCGFIHFKNVFLNFCLKKQKF